MLHHLQFSASFADHTVYEDKDAYLKESLRTIYLHEFPHDANVISSHTIYKVKVCDDDSHALNARIAPHRNEDDPRSFIRSDCAMGILAVMRIPISTPSLIPWKLHNLDGNSAFPQTGSAVRDLYLIPARESPVRGKVLWLL